MKFTLLAHNLLTKIVYDKIIARVLVARNVHRPHSHFPFGLSAIGSAKCYDELALFNAGGDYMVNEAHAFPFESVRFDGCARPFDVPNELHYKNQNAGSTQSAAVAAADKTTYCFVPFATSSRPPLLVSYFIAISLQRPVRWQGNTLAKVRNTISRTASVAVLVGLGYLVFR